MFCWLFQCFEKQKWVTYLTDSPKPPPQRITFTFPLINSSSEIAMVVTGGDAANAVKVALGKHANDYYPLLAQKIAPEGTLTWFLDNEATLKLSKSIADHGLFSVVLSGGTLFDTLRKIVEPPYLGANTQDKHISHQGRIITRGSSR
nr:probable 6-phosphogluconolactonase 4, chloroplastic [Tanacetum cinerariifolium]